MGNKIVKIEGNKEELTSIEEMIAGCDSGVITYGIDKDYNVHKVVTLFTRTSHFAYQSEEFGASHSKTLAMNPKMALCKRYDYKIQGQQVKKSIINYYKVLFRTLIGFVKDSETHDLRHKYEYKES